MTGRRTHATKRGVGKGTADQIGSRKDAAAALNPERSRAAPAVAVNGQNRRDPEKDFGLIELDPSL